MAHKSQKNIKKISSAINKLKKEKQTPSILRSIIRLKALKAYYKGLEISVISQCFDISEKTLKRWINTFNNSGCESLIESSRSGRPPKLTAEQEIELKKIITEDNEKVWVARNIFTLIATTFGVIVSISYLPQLLRRIGLTFHKAILFLAKRNNEKRKKWIQETLPSIYKKKIKEGWRIFYQDEVGFQTSGTLAYTWGEKNKKTEIKNYGRHGRMNLMGAFELQTGNFYGVLTSFRVNAMRFRRFICHLKREMKTDKILLICDNASFHKAKWLTEWINKNSDWIKLEFLPAYSPDFNPIERLWKWMKKEYTHNRCWRTKKELKKHLNNAIHEMYKSTNDFISVMKKENERFKKIFEYYKVKAMEVFSDIEKIPAL